MAILLPQQQEVVTLKDLKAPSAAERMEAMLRLRSEDFDTSAQAIERLAELLSHEDTEQRVAAAFALGRFDQRAWQALKWALECGDAELRAAAAESIEKAVDLVGPIQQELHCGERLSRRLRFARYSPGLAKNLALALRDDVERVRYFAALALYKLGAGAVFARGALAKACDDESAGVRLLVRAALEPLTRKPGDVTRAALTALGQADEVATAACPRLDELNAAPEFDPWAILYDCGDVGKADSADHIALLRWIRERAPALLARVDERASGSIEAFRELRQAEADLAHADGLIELEIGRLMVCQRDERWSCDGPGARALVELGPVVMPQLQREYLRVRQFPRGDWTPQKVAWMLEQLGTEALPTLIFGLEHIYPQVREQSATSIVMLGEDWEPARLALGSAWRADVNFPSKR